MKVRHVPIATFIVVSFMTSTAVAIPGHLPDLDKTTAESTLIVLGELVSVEKGIRSISIQSSELNARFGIALTIPKIDARVDRGTFRIDEVLKGERASSNLTFEYLLPEVFIGWNPPERGTYGIFFFRRTESGTLELTNPYFSWIQVPKELHVSGETPLDRVTKLLGVSIATPSTTRETKTMAMFWLQFSKSSASNLAIRNGLGDPDLEVRLSAAGALMFKGDASGLDVVKRAFLSGIPVPGNYEELVSNQIRDLGDLRDPKLVPDFEQLLGSTSTYMRRGAGFALMRTGLPEAASGLRKMLVDPDLEVRYNGVVGLADIQGEKEWRPSIQEFKSEETKYLSHFSR